MKLIFSIFILFVLVGCSKQSKPQSKITVSFKSFLESDFTGGGILRVVNTVTEEEIDFELKPPYLVTIPHGTWDMYFVGFRGATAWTGVTDCGVTEEVVLSTDEATVEITASNSNCSAATYVAMKATKGVSTAPLGIATWDTSNWDGAAWAP